jgi:hypothetical protein
MIPVVEFNVLYWNEIVTVYNLVGARCGSKVELWYGSDADEPLDRLLRS